MTTVKVVCPECRGDPDLPRCICDAGFVSATLAEGERERLLKEAVEGMPQSHMDGILTWLLQAKVEGRGRDFSNITLLAALTGGA